mmetsp:Transcript_43365/g.72092  ORF Transcript_43365/g.72092 Transcript_43365/m.72092 type:complete len:131 (+) Transcript_43365:417-809(+)
MKLAPTGGATRAIAGVPMTVATMTVATMIAATMIDVMMTVAMMTAATMTAGAMRKGHPSDRLSGRPAPAMIAIEVNQLTPNTAFAGQRAVAVHEVIIAPSQVEPPNTMTNCQWLLPAASKERMTQPSLMM